MNKEAKGSIEAALSILRSVQDILPNLNNAKNLMEDAVSKLNQGKHVLWVNIYQKNKGTAFETFHAGDFLFGSEEEAKLRVGNYNKNQYFGAFPVDFGTKPPSIQSIDFGERKYISLADKDFDEQASLLMAAHLYYKYVPVDEFNSIVPKGKSIIPTIKFIRYLSGCNLPEAKQLVDYAVGGSKKPLWFKSASQVVF